ncbi:MAG: winged helix-turn-helix transcriptional regulator [Bacteroidales bacterium]|nr:winged helix-turn-helix transcriptional regulator [Bacteroidales bacterium]
MLVNLNVIQLNKQLLQAPITDAKHVAELLNISPSTANRLIKQLIDLGILTEITGYKRNRKYIFKEYFEIFKTDNN